MPYKDPIKAKENRKEYYLKHKEKIREYFKKYNLENRETINKKQKIYTIKNKEKIKEYIFKNKEKRYADNKEYRLKNRQYLNAKSRENNRNPKNKEYKKQYCINNKENILEQKREYLKKRRKSDPVFKLRCITATLIYNAIKKRGYKKTSRTNKILGCDYEFFKEYIEAKFIKGMSWDNQGKWHLDHIMPLKTARSEGDIIRLNHYTNFQPLWAKDNLEKHAKIIPYQLVLI